MPRKFHAHGQRGLAKRRGIVSSQEALREIERDNRSYQLELIQPEDIERWHIALMAKIDTGSVAALRLFAEYAYGPLKQESKVESVDVAKILEMVMGQQDKEKVIDVESLG
mgnify:CR=1 FL=1